MRYAIHQEHLAWSQKISNNLIWIQRSILVIPKPVTQKPNERTLHKGTNAAPISQ